MLADSSEAMLSGRKPPFRLLVKAVHLRGAHINVRHAVSEGFVVATRRTRTAGKVRVAVDAATGEGVQALMRAHPVACLLLGERPLALVPLPAGAHGSYHSHSGKSFQTKCCTRTAWRPQVEIPNVDDHISKLEHMGKETVKKLADIRGSAQVGWAAAAGVQWQLAASHL